MMKNNSLFWVLFVVSALFMNSCSQKSKDGIKFTIDPSKAITNQFLGNGVQWSAYPHADSEDAEWGLLMTDERWQQVFDRLDFMQPRIVRVIDQANWRYLKGFDEKGNPVIDYETPEMRSLEKLLGYCQENNIDVLFGEWGAPYQVHDTDAGYSGLITGADDEVWLNMIVDYLDYMVNERGYTCIKYYNLVNEPNGDWASTDGDWDEWSSGIKLLYKKLSEKGLSDQIQIAGPDAVAHYDHPESEYSGVGWALASMEQLNEQIGLYDIHAYTDFELVKSGGFTDFYRPIAEKAGQLNKPVIFGELGFGRDSEENQKRIEADPYTSGDSQMSVYDFSYGIDMADALIQLMSVGYGGAVAWSLDDAMHTLGDKGEKDQLKRWGMWNILGTELHDNPEDEEIRPWFFTWSLMCRYFKPGMNIVSPEGSSAEGLRLVSGMDGEDITIAVVNNSEFSRTVTLEMPWSDNFRLYRYEDNNRKTNEQGFPVPEKDMELSGSVTMDVAPNSFQLLTTYN
jgi:hypothetical protein